MADDPPKVKKKIGRPKGSLGGGRPPGHWIDYFYIPPLDAYDLKPCTRCSGKGQCPHCEGSGSGNRKGFCYHCRGDGLCVFCDGLGEVDPFDDSTDCF